MRLYESEYLNIGIYQASDAVAYIDSFLPWPITTSTLLGSESRTIVRM